MQKTSTGEKHKDGSFVLIAVKGFWKCLRWHLPLVQLFKVVVVGSWQDYLGKHFKNMHVQTWGMCIKKTKHNTCNVIGGKSLNCNLTSFAVVLECVPWNKRFLWLNV